MKLASIKRKKLRNFLLTAPLMHICVCLPFRFIHDKDSFDRGCLCAVTSGGHYEMTHLNSSWIPHHVNVKIPLPHALRQIHTNIQNVSAFPLSDPFQLRFCLGMGGWYLARPLQLAVCVIFCRKQRELLNYFIPPKVTATVQNTIDVLIYPLCVTMFEFAIVVI